MRSLVRGLVVLAGVLALSGCGSSSGSGSANGSPADPPTDLAATAGDGQVTLSWTMATNDQYTVYYAPATSISSTNWTTIAGSKSLAGVTSPVAIGGLANGTTYAFAMDARINGGTGGASTPSVTAVPRAAGSRWTLGAAIGTSDLNAITYGAISSNLYMAVGAGGRIVSSPDGTTWTTLNNSASSANLNAVVFGRARYVAAGAGGAIVTSVDGVNWTADASSTTNTIYGLVIGATGFVGVGANGTITYSFDGITWNNANSGTSRDLLAITFGNGHYVAVGAGGTLLTSIDGVTWTAAASNTALDLRSIVYGTNVANSTTIFVAVGASGALTSSADGINWTASSSLPATTNFNGITFNSQFVLVGDGGAIYTSTTGSSWQVQASGTSNHLKAVTHSASSYSAVGTSGTNLLAL